MTYNVECLKDDPQTVKEKLCLGLGSLAIIVNKSVAKFPQFIKIDYTNIAEVFPRRLLLGIEKLRCLKELDKSSHRKTLHTLFSTTHFSLYFLDPESILFV